MTYTVCAFYKFAHIPDPDALRDRLQEVCAQAGTTGTILVAHEGINGTIAGEGFAVAMVVDRLRSVPPFHDLSVKLSRASERPFQRMKVKVKQEIVTFGAPQTDPASRVGTYVKPHEWNALISRDDVVVIDTRNDYEVAIGTFRGAIDPGTGSFSQFPDFVKANLDPAVHTKVAMFCTGGIRCEKASAYMLSLGFPEVYHLDGGILKYLKDVPLDASMWDGACFVFDERVSVVQGVAPGEHTLCKCGFPINRAEVMCPSCGSSHEGRKPTHDRDIL